MPSNSSSTISNVSKRHWKLKEKARKLRAEGLSYNELIKHIPVAKSTISLWVRDIVLTSEQKRRLYARHESSMIGIRAIQKIFWKRRCDAFDEGKKLYWQHKDAPGFIGGLMLYWAEGGKTKNFAFTNSDKMMIRVMTSWLRAYFDIHPKNLTLSLNIHSGQNEIELLETWMKLTKIPSYNLRKTFIKPEGAGYKKNILYYGTARIRIKGQGSTYKLFTLLGALSEYLKDAYHMRTIIEDWIPKLPHA